MRHYSLDLPEAEQLPPAPSETEQSDAPISILKKYAKTVFNKCAESPETPLTPMEQAKFDAAHAMMRDGKTTRYAYYKYKNEFEKPVLDSYRNLLSGHAVAESRNFDLSDQALRKVANFIDGLDQDKLAALKEDQAAYADFVAEAYMISHIRAGRSKSRRIADTLDAAVGEAPNETTEKPATLNLNTADLHALIEDNINGELDTDTIAAEMTSLAENMQKPLSELSDIIRTMPAADREADGIQENCFFLFKKFIGINTNSRRALGAIGNMMTFMTASFSERMPEMIDDLKDAQAAGDYHDFMGKYASPLIKTYQYLAPTGYLTNGAAEVDEEAFVRFVADMDEEWDQIASAPNAAPNRNAHQAPAAPERSPLQYSRGPNARSLYTRFEPETESTHTPVAAIG